MGRRMGELLSPNVEKVYCGSSKIHERFWRVLVKVFPHFCDDAKWSEQPHETD